MTAPAADEQISVAITRPIPLRNAPPGCEVRHTERYCRDDGQVVKSYKVLEQSTSGSSAVESFALDRGCLAIEMKLGMPVSSVAGNSCEAGIAKVSLKLLVSTKAM